MFVNMQTVMQQTVNGYILVICFSAVKQSAIPLSVKLVLLQVLN